MLVRSLSTLFLSRRFVYECCQYQDKVALIKSSFLSFPFFLGRGEKEEEEEQNRMFISSFYSELYFSWIAGFNSCSSVWSGEH